MIEWMGPRRAAARRTAFEMNLGLPIDKLHCGARILYRAPCDDQKFLEYELDYIIFSKLSVPQCSPNPDEVQNHKFVALKDLETFVSERKGEGQDITPWFRLIW